MWLSHLWASLKIPKNVQDCATDELNSDTDSRRQFMEAEQTSEPVLLELHLMKTASS